MTYKYIIIDSDSQSSMNLQTHIAALNDFYFLGYASNREDGINCILENSPDIIFLGTNTIDSNTTIDFSLINELYKYMIILPKIIIVSDSKEIAYEAMKFDVYDFLLKPFQKMDIVKTLMKYRKERSFVSPVDYDVLKEKKLLSQISNPIIEQEIFEKPLAFTNVSNEMDQAIENIEEIPVREVSIVDFKLDTKEIQQELVELVKQSLETNATKNGHAFEPSAEAIPKKNILCIKSYGDYRFIEFNDIVYLKADNNSTDIILSTGDSITAFKTLKHFESSLPEEFLRIHNSHIVNIGYVSRIHLGNSDCYLNKGKIKLPFSKSYKDNINAIIELHAPNGLKDD